MVRLCSCFFVFLMKNILYDSLWKKFLEPTLRTAPSNLHLQSSRFYIMLIIQRTPTHRTLLCSDLKSFPQIIRSQCQNCKFVSVSILLIVVHIKEGVPNICFRLIILHGIALANNLQVFKIYFMLIILRRTPSLQHSLFC